MKLPFVKFVDQNLILCNLFATLLALIQKGSDTHMVVKEYISDIDYIDYKVDVNLGTQKKPAFKKMRALSPAGGRHSGITSKFKDERMGGGIFTIDGITIGMEICLDHVESGGRLASHSSSIQILLIPSYGMDITNLHCVNRGIIFNVDGRENGSSKVFIKAYAGTPFVSNTFPIATGGEIEKWGPFDIPRHI